MLNYLVLKKDECNKRVSVYNSLERQGTLGNMQIKHVLIKYCSVSIRVHTCSVNLSLGNMLFNNGPWLTIILTSGQGGMR